MKNQVLKCPNCNLNFHSETVKLSPKETQWICPNCESPQKVPVEAEKGKAVKVVPLHTVPLEIQPNKDSIKMLEGIIERIKAGEITSVGLAYTTSEGSIGGDVSTGSDNFLMWASLEHLARTFYSETVLGHP